MKKLLLGIIAINLTFLSIITTLNYMQTANAQLGSSLQRVEICSGSSYDLRCLEVHKGSGGTHIHVDD